MQTTVWSSNSEVSENFFVENEKKGCCFESNIFNYSLIFYTNKSLKMKFELQDFREIFFDKNERKNWCLETNTFNYLLIFYTNKKFEVKAQIRRSLRIFHFVKVLYLLTSA